MTALEAWKSAAIRIAPDVKTPALDRIIKQLKKMEPKP